MSTYPPVSSTIHPGDRNQPVARVEAGPLTLTVYASLVEPGRIVVEVDGDTDPLKLYVNDTPTLPQQAAVTITREQLEAWAGRLLTDEEVERVDDALPHSSIPESIATIVDSLNGDNE